MVNIFLASRFEEFFDLRVSVAKELNKLNDTGIDIKVINLDDKNADGRSAINRSLDSTRESDILIDNTFLYNQGFNLMGRLTRNFYRPSKLTGMHNEKGFILTKGKGVEKEVPLEPTVEDIVSLINN